MSYKAWMCTGGDDWNTNALVFATDKEAEDYAKDLSYRWTLVEQYEVRKSDEEVNYGFIDGQLTTIDSTEPPMRIRSSLVEIDEVDVDDCIIPTCVVTGYADPLALYLVRGLPGSGKTTVAHELCNTVFSADDYFDKMAGEMSTTYSAVFDPRHLPEAHGQCQNHVVQAMKDGKTVAVANTFVTKWEAEPYFAMASDYGYTVCVVHCQSQFGSVHNVPEESIEEMRKRWEEDIHP